MSSVAPGLGLDLVRFFVDATTVSAKEYLGMDM